MSETTTLDAPSTTGEAAPSDVTQPPVSTEQPAGIVGESTPSTEQGTQEPAAPVTPPAPPAPRTVQEIEAAIADPAGQVTGAEYQRLQSYRDQVANTRQRIDQQRSQARTEFTNTQASILSAVTEELTNAANADRAPDMALIEAKAKLALDPLMSKAETAALASLDADVDSWLYSYYQGPTAGYDQATKGKNLREKMDVQLTLAYEAGRKAGPSADYIVETKAERDAAIQAAINSARPAASGTSVGGAAAAATSSRSDAEVLADPNTPVTQLTEIRARQRAARGY